MNKNIESASLYTIPATDLDEVTGARALPQNLLENLKAQIRSTVDQSLATARAAMAKRPVVK